MSNTGEAIRLEVGRTLNGLHKKTILKEIVNTGTSAAQITSLADLGSTRYTPQMFTDYWARVTLGNRDGDLTFARALTASTGVLTVSPNFSGALANLDTLELWSPEGFNPDDIDLARDRALTQRCTRWRLTPLSFVRNPDIISATGWTGSTASVAIESGTFPYSYAESEMKVTNSGANGYAYTADIPARAADAWSFYALVRTTTGDTSQFRIRDVSNSAYITPSFQYGSETYTGIGYEVLKGTFTIPSGCTRIAVHAGAVGAAAVVWYSDIILQPEAATEFALPQRIASSAFVGHWYGVDGKEWPEQTPTPIAAPKLIDTGGDVRAVFPSSVGSQVIFFEEKTYYSALQSAYNTAAGRLAGDAATTDCPLEYAKWGTLEELYPGRFTTEWRNAHRLYGAKRMVRMTEG